MAKSISKHSHVVTANATGFTAELTKMQKSLGLVRDENGMLTNSQGKLVESLSTTKIRMGQWIDENARLRNSNGQIIEGLNAAQLALGFYKDEMGNLLNRQGEVIRQSPILLARQREFAAAQKEANAQLRTGAAATMQLTGLLIGLGSESGKATRTMFVLSSGMTVFQSVSGAIPSVVNGLTALNAVLKGTVATTAILEGLTGNIVGLVAGGAAAVGVMAWASQMDAAGTQAESTIGKVDNLTDSVKRLQEVAKSGGKSTWGIGEMSSVISEMAVSQNDQLRASIQGISDRRKKTESEIEALEDKIKKHSQFLQSEKERTSFFGVEGLGAAGGYLEGMENRIKTWKKEMDDLKNQGDDGLAGALSGMFSSIIESNKTEQEKIREQIDNIRLSSSEGLDGDGKGQEALRILEDRAYTLSDEYQAQQKAAEDQKKEAEQLKKEQEQLAGSLKKYASDVDKVHEEFGFLAKITDSVILQSEAYEKAQEEYRKKLEEAGKSIEQKEQDALKAEIDRKYMTEIESAVERMEKLNAIRDREYENEGAWQNAMDEARGSLLKAAGVSKYFDEIETASEEFARVAGEIRSKGLLAGKSEEEIQKAQQRAEKELLGKSNVKGNDATAAATRGSVEAYKITNNAQDKTTNAVKTMDKNIGQLLTKVNSNLEKAFQNPWDSVEII